MKKLLIFLVSILSFAPGVFAGVANLSTTNNFTPYPFYNNDKSLAGYAYTSLSLQQFDLGDSIVPGFTYETKATDTSHQLFYSFPFGADKDVLLLGLQQEAMQLDFTMYNSQDSSRTKVASDTRQIALNYMKNFNEGKSFLAFSLTQYTVGHSEQTILDLADGDLDAELSYSGSYSGYEILYNQEISKGLRFGIHYKPQAVSSMNAKANVSKSYVSGGTTYTSNDSATGSQSVGYQTETTLGIGYKMDRYSFELDYIQGDQNDTLQRLAFTGNTLIFGYHSELFNAIIESQTLSSSDAVIQDSEEIGYNYTRRQFYLGVPVESYEVSFGYSIQTSDSPTDNSLITMGGYTLGISGAF